MRFIPALMVIAAVLFLASGVQASDSYTWRQTLDGIRVVETGGEPNEGVGAKGDGGKAAGPYQIHLVYHIDAAERDKRLTAYSRCLNSKAYSERVIRAYMNRYCRESLQRLEKGRGTLADIQRIARTHNGGPKGHKKKATLNYWNRVKKEVTR